MNSSRICCAGHGGWILRWLFHRKIRGATRFPTLLHFGVRNTGSYRVATPGYAIRVDGSGGVFSFNLAASAAPVVCQGVLGIEIGGIHSGGDWLTHHDFAGLHRAARRNRG